MNRRTADVLAAAIVGVVSLVGLVWTYQVWTAAQTSATGGMMDGMMDGGMMQPAPSPIGPLFGTVVLVAVLGGGYLLVRDHLVGPNRATPGADVEAFAADSPLQSSEASATETDGVGGSATTETEPEPAPTGASVAGSTGADADATVAEDRARRILEVLPEDERRVLEPVVESPGLTQIALRDRADFSKSKVSQTLSDLEKRGLVARERQGRTYRVYPSGDLDERR
ncbi:MAG: helix-turn-helix transcriptional regulator [Halanaeroarchaeum sp.]